MSVQQVLADIAARGLTIGAAGADLKLQGPRDRIDAELVGRIKSVKAELIEHLQAAEDEQRHSFELTLLQRGYLIGRGDSVELGNVASHVYHEIDGHWDLDRLQAALRSVLVRHGMLRTRFTDDGRQVCTALPDEFGIDRIDLTGLTGQAQADRLAELREQRSHRVLPADRAPMLAVEVVLLGGEDPQRRMRLLVGHDGLVMDGISMFLFFRHWSDAYHGPLDSAELEPAARQAAAAEASFADYVVALGRSREQRPYRRSREYWLDRIEDLAPYPDLALQTSPASISRPRFSQHVARLDVPAWTVLKARAAAAGLTPTSLLVAGYAEVLHRWGAGSAFTLNSTLANRPPIHPQIFAAIGNFSETMLIEIELDHRSSFTQRAQALQARLRRDLDNRHYSGIEVLRELGRRQGADRARMPYTFNSTIGYVDASLDGSTLELFGPEVYTSSQTPQVWLNGFAFEQHGGLVVQFDSVDGLFPDGMIEAMVAGYQRLLDELAAADEQHAARSWAATAFDLLPEEQRQRRAEANDTDVALAETPLEQGLLDQVARDPDALAVIGSQAGLSYRELLDQASAAAAWLRANQVGRDELVGLVMTRGPEQVIGIVACILAGAAYLPIDAGLPVERQRYLLRDGRVRCVLTNVENWQPPEAILVRPARSAVAEQPPVPPPLPGAGLADLAYVLYTSGTTGEPKGVMVSRRSVANVVADCQRRFVLSPSDRLFGISAFNFDLSVWDVFGALSAGAAIVLPDHDRAADPAHWLQLCEQAGVTVWNSVPAIVALLHDEATGSGRVPALAALRLVMMSGDRIPPELPGLLHAMKPDLQVVSLGGPTETTIWNILHPIEQAGPVEAIPYGRPNANNRAYILDAGGQDCPDWVAGEIHAAGTGLARGYWGDAERTAARFFDDPVRGERLFATGDLGRYLPDGTIAILGRSDFQIKINGYRIEAGEVETRLVSIAEIKQAAVVRQSGARGDRLVAHLAPAGDQRPADELIRAELRRYLPEYMLPTTMHWHDSLPLTKNGKVDRGRLSAEPGPASRAPATAAAETGAAPAGELETRLAELWAGVLKCPVGELSRDGNFYAIGGDSLAAARILTGMRKQFGISLTLDRFFEVDTIAGMAGFLHGALGPDAAGRPGARLGIPQVGTSPAGAS